MKKYSALDAVIRGRRDALRAKTLAAKRANDPNAVLTSEEQFAIDKELQTIITAEMLAEQPTVDPSIIVKAFNENGIPELELASKEEYAARKEKQVRANMAYSTGIFAMSKYIPGYGDFERPREEQGLCRQMTPEELQVYSEYYSNKTTENKKRIKRIFLDIVKRVADKYVDNLDENMPDDELIDQFPSLYSELDFIQESDKILDEAAAETYYEDFPPEEIAKYKAIVSTLMTKSAVLSKRVQMMADPYYPHIRLEKTLQLDPNRVYNADPTEDLSEDGKYQLDLSSEPYKEYADPKDIPAPSMAPPTEYGKKLDGDSNIISTAADIAFSMRILHEARIAAKLGMSMEQLNAQYNVYDKTGKQLSSSLSPTELLTNNDVIYYVSKYGNGKALPVMLDKTKSDYVVHVGSDEIAAAENLPAVAPQAPGFFASIANFFHKMFYDGEPTERYARYEAELEEYNKKFAYNESKRKADDGTFEEAIQQINKKNAERNDDLLLNEEVVKARQDAIRKDVNYLANIPSTEEFSAMQRNILAELLVNRAFLESADSKFRTAMFNTLGYGKEGFKESEALGAFKDSNKFKEFAWIMRHYKANLLEDLRSADPDIANRALRDIQDEFTAGFLVVKSSGNSTNREYSEYSAIKTAETKANSTVAENAVVSKDNRKNMDARHDNVSLWDAVLAIYGPERKFRPEWTQANGRSIYGIDDWLKMKEQDINLSELKPENKAIDERTFASLAMILSMRESEFFKTLPSLNGKSIPDTQPFEDILLDIDKPRDGINRILPVLIEPTRANLLNNLKHMNEIVPGSDPESTGKELLAKDLANVLKIYIAHAKTFSWGKREQSVFTEVCDKVMDFANEHGMTELIKKNGIEDKDIEDLKISSALGKITKDAYEAQYDLVCDAEGDKSMSLEARKECIKKMILLKAVQADAEGAKKDVVMPDPPKKEDFESGADFNKALEDYTNFFVKLQNGELGNGFEYSANAKNVLGDSSFMDDIAERMMSNEERDKLANAGSGEIFKGISLGVGDKLQHSWANYLKENEAKENTRHLEMKQAKDLFNRMQELQNKGELWTLTPAVEAVMKNGAPEAKKLILSLDDEKLTLLNKEFSKDTKRDLNKMLMEYIQKANQQNKQLGKEAELKAEGPKLEEPVMNKK